MSKQWNETRYYYRVKNFLAASESDSGEDEISDSVIVPLREAVKTRGCLNGQAIPDPLELFHWICAENYRRRLILHT